MIRTEYNLTRILVPLELINDLGRLWRWHQRRMDGETKLLLSCQGCARGASTTRVRPTETITAGTSQDLETFKQMLFLMLL